MSGTRAAERDDDDRRSLEAPLLQGGGGSEAVEEAVERGAAAAAAGELWRAAAVAALAPVSFGVALGYTSPASRLLRCGGAAEEEELGGDEALCLSQAQLDLFGSVVTLAAAAGTLLAGKLADTAGRAGGLRCVAVPAVCGWGLVALARGVPALLAGRVLVGLATGVVSAVAPVYLTEVATPALRGALGTANQLAVVSGVLLVYLLGLECFGLTWRQLAALCAAPSGALLALSPFLMPESPSWLLTRHLDTGRAARALKRLRGGDDAAVAEELAAMTADARAAHANVAAVTPLDLLRPPLRHPWLVTIMLMLFQQGSGVNAIVFYSQDVFANAGINNADVAALSTGVLQVVMTFVCVNVIDRAGRRPLLVTASAAQGVASAAMAVSIWHGGDVGHYCAVGSALLYVMAFALGLGPIPWLLNAELLPDHAKGVAGGASSLVNWVGAYAITASFTSLNAALGGEAGSFALFAGVNLLCSACVFALLPESKGLTPAQVAARFAGAEAPSAPLDA